MAYNVCIVIGCPNSKKKVPGVAYYKVPTGYKRRKWLEALDRTDLMSPSDSVAKIVRVCERHFHSQMIYTDKDNKRKLQFAAFPSCNLPSKDKGVGEETASTTYNTTTTVSLDLCIASGCPNGKQCVQGVGYYKLPGYHRLFTRHRWLHALERTDLISLASDDRKDLRVCERHFLTQMIYTDKHNERKLKLGAFPLFNHCKAVDEEKATTTPNTTSTYFLNPCIVSGCPNREWKSDVEYFKLTTGFNRRKWLEAAGRPDLLSTVNDATMMSPKSDILMICERHFFSHMISTDQHNNKILQLTAVPILNLPRSSTYLNTRKERETNCRNILKINAVNTPVQSTSGEPDDHQIIKTDPDPVKEAYRNVFDHLLDIEMYPIKSEKTELDPKNISLDTSNKNIAKYKNQNTESENHMFEDNIKTEYTISFNEGPIKEESLEVETDEPEDYNIDEYYIKIEDVNASELNTDVRISPRADMDSYSETSSQKVTGRESLVHTQASDVESEAEVSETEHWFGGPSYKPPALSRVLKLYLPEQPPSAAATPPLPTEGLQRPLHLFHFEWRSLKYPIGTGHALDMKRAELFHHVKETSTTKMTPLSAFSAIWDTNFMEQITTWTNLRAQRFLSSRKVSLHSKYQCFGPVTTAELYVYFAIVIGMGMSPKKYLKEYFRKNFSITDTPNFSKYMAHFKFSMFNRFIRFSDDGDKKFGMTKEESQYKAFEKLLNHLNDKFQSLYVVDRDLIIDQSLQGFPEFLPPYNTVYQGIDVKSYEVCDAKTGYMYRCYVSIMKQEDDEVPDTDIFTGATAIVLNLLSGLKNRGHSVYMDSNICSPALARVLKSQGFDCIGVLNRHCALVPWELAQLRPGDLDGETLAWTSGDLDIISWNERGRLLSMVSTYHGNISCVSRHREMKPRMFLDYTTCMEAMDRTDSSLADYPIERQQSVLYKKLFRRLLNVSIHNAYLIYKKASGHLRHHDFRHELIREMLANYHKPSKENDNDCIQKKRKA